MIREGKILEFYLFLGTKSRRRKNTQLLLLSTLYPHPIVTYNDYGYGSNAIWNSTSTKLSIHYALECICGGTSEGLLSDLSRQPKFLSQ